ncbi:MAG: FkbM family methyltransferase, partial [Anaerolineales bacterium]|nr:FkbM family methyltransferase [Anaerolineales bacterium]
MPNPILTLAARTARLLPNALKQALYKIDPLARLLRGVLNRAAPEGLSTVSVAAGMLTGAQLQLNLQAEKDYWLGTYEPELHAAITAHVQPGMTAYDVGANIGYISLGLARAVGTEGLVWAFEALPANQQRLRANVALNPDLKVNVVPQAVTGQSGPVDFLVHASGEMGKAAGSAGRQESYAETITV